MEDRDELMEYINLHTVLYPHFYVSSFPDEETGNIKLGSSEFYHIGILARWYLSSDNVYWEATRVV